MRFALLPLLLLLGSPALSAQDLTVRLEPIGGSGARGIATLQTYTVGTRIELLASGASDGLHGVAIVDASTCMGADADHVDDGSHPHGDPEDPRPLHHTGDLGNIRFMDGDGRLDRIFTDVHLDGTSTIRGRLLILYSASDDLNSQPRGDSGDPIACGVIPGGGTP